ncbi:MAG: hypothetical protein IRZ32_17860 [Solirubrobacteraceae bacterium]|nr:hypothetical protein [Solirubrobacteraceae bacterium]
MSSHHEIAFTDELLADGTVYRRYSDGRQEWRRRAGWHLVEWRNERGLTGTDEQLGRRIIKRVYAGVKARYGRDLGYGRTAWRQHPADPTDPPPSPQPVLFITVNRSAFRGRVGTLLAGAGAGVLLGPVIAPPLTLTPAEEEQLRRALAQQISSRGGGDGDDFYGWDDGDDDADGFGDDFG